MQADAMTDDQLNDQSGAEEPSAGADTGVAQAEAEDPIEELRREKSALQDRLLRTAAEFDNYRKRVDRERREHAESAAADLLTDVLPIVDDLERALQAPASGEADSYRRGVELIHRQMLELLRKRGVKPIEAVGTLFDPRFHQAVTQETSPHHREGEVIEELR